MNTSKLFLRSTTLIRFCALAFVLIFLASCTHVRPVTKVTIAQGIDIPLLLPTRYETVTQKVTGTFHHETHVLIMQIQTQADKITIAGLTPTGTRLFTVNFDGQQISSWKSPLFNAPFDGAYILADFQLSTLDVKSLKHILPDNMHISEAVLGPIAERRFTGSSGDTIIQVRYSNADNRSAGVIDYCHLQRDYCLHIENFENADIP